MRTIRTLCTLVALLGAGRLTAQDDAAAARVGSLGAPASIELRGVEFFAPRTLLEMAYATATAWPRTHPFAPRAKFVEWLRARIERAYRWEGFAGVAVAVAVKGAGEKLVVTVEEGPRTRAGAFEVVGEGLDPVLIAGLREEFATLWTEGGPAPSAELLADAGLGPRAEACCRALGALAARVEGAVTVVGEDGRVELRLTIGGGQIVGLNEVRLSGVDADEARRALDHVGFQAGRPPTRDAIDALVAALAATGRFRAVSVDPVQPPPASGRLDLQVVPQDGLPPWNEMPWDDMAALRRAAQHLPQQLTGPGRTTLVMRPDPGEGGPQGSVELTVARAGARLVFRGVELGPLGVDDVAFAVGADGSLALESRQVGRLWTAPATFAGEGSGLLLSLLFLPSDGSDPTRRSRFMYGFGWQQRRDAAELLRRGFDAVLPIGSRLDLGVQLHGAAAWDIATRHRSDAPHRDGELLLRIGAVDDAVRIDRATGALQLRLERGPVTLTVEAEADALDAGAVVRGDGLARLIEPGLLALLADGQGERAAPLVHAAAPLLADGVRDLLSGLIDGGLIEGGLAQVPAVPEPAGTPAGATLVAVVDGIGRRLAARQPPSHWLHAMLRDLPGLLLDPGRRLRAFEAVLATLAEDEAPGPLGFAAIAWLLRLRGLDEHALEFAQRGSERSSLLGFVRDLEAVGAGGGLLDAIGRVWRDECGIVAADDRGAARAGLRVLWDAGLGAALGDQLRRLAGR